MADANNTMNKPKIAVVLGASGYMGSNLAA